MKTALSIIISSLVLLGNAATAEVAEKVKNTNVISLNSHYAATINGITLDIAFVAPDIVKVVKSKGKNASNKVNCSILNADKPLPFSVKKNGNVVFLTTDSMSVGVDTHTGILSFFDKKQKLLMKEAKPGKIEPLNEPLDNQKLFKTQQAFNFQPHEAIYGFGQHQVFNLNQRNQHISMKHVNMEIGIPFFQSTNGYGLFWHNYSKTDFTDKDGIGTLESEVGENIEYYFIKGTNADQVIKNYRQLTGGVPMFPLWAFGYAQSKERYRSQFELVDVVKKYRSLKVPLDVIIQDWQYWGEDVNHWNSTEFNAAKFPRPKQMVDSIHAMNSHILISTWPSFGSETNIYKDLQKQNALFDFKTYPVTDNVKVYDAFNPAARKIYWEHVEKNLYAVGIDGWWLDATEPIVKQLKTKAVDNHHENEVKDSSESVKGIKTYLGSFNRYGNLYPLLTVENFYTNQRKKTDEKRVFILTRSAFAGQQRDGCMLWSGDVKSTWDALKQQIPAGVSLSYTGLPYWNSDIGGFHSSQSYPQGINDKGFQELYVRWTEFAAFTAMMRSHGANTPREIYQFGKPGDWAYDAIYKYINFRYRLLPYIYANAWKTTSQASSIMRGLAMDFSNDPNVYDIANQYMFGSNILVVPVTDAMYVKNGIEDFSITKSQKVYLPKGTAWYDFWTGQKLDGGRSIEKNAPIDIIPLYIRAGSILPLGPLQQYTGEKSWDNLEIRIYPGADGEFTLYEDEGDNYNYEKGQYTEIKLRWDNAQKTLHIDNRKGAYSNMLKNRTFNFTIVGTDSGIGIDTSTSISKTINYTGQKLVVEF